MSESAVKKIALSFSLVAFGVLAIGSGLNGARSWIAFLRGVEGAVVFGLVAWALGLLFVEKNETPPPADARKPDQDSEGAKLDQTA